MGYPPKPITPTNYHHHGNANAFNTLPLPFLSLHIYQEGDIHCQQHGGFMVRSIMILHHISYCATKEIFCVNDDNHFKQPAHCPLPPPYPSPSSHQLSLHHGSLLLWERGIEGCQHLCLCCSFKKLSAVSLIKIGSASNFAMEAQSDLFKSLQFLTVAPLFSFFKQIWLKMQWAAVEEHRGYQLHFKKFLPYICLIMI